MEMPKPQAEHTKLAQLAGTWEGEETLSASPWGPGGKAFGRYTMRSDLDGFFVIQDYVEERDGKVSFRGHGVFGFDSNAKQYTWYWVDSMGGPADPARGSWNGDTMIFTSKNPQNEGRYTWRFE